MVSAEFARHQDLEEMSDSAWAGNADLGKSLVRLARILPYRSRRVTVAFAFAEISLHDDTLTISGERKREGSGERRSIGSLEGEPCLLTAKIPGLRKGKSFPIFFRFWPLLL
jgi:hypothetical protein